VTFQAVLPPQTEREFQASVVKYAKMLGYRVYHTHDSRRSVAGFPDLVLVRRPRIVFAELKSQRGRVTDDQAYWIRDLRACGAEVYLWRPSDWPAVEGILR
jgi:hypothetical protein